MKQTNILTGKSGEKGQALLELALVLPLIFVLLAGIVDYSRAIHAKSIITQMSREAANLVARPNSSLTGVATDDFQNAMYFVAKDAGQLDMMNYGKMYITRAEYISGTNTITAKVPWNQGMGSLPSNLPALGATGFATSALGNNNTIDLSTAQVVYVVEVFYLYRSIFPGDPFSFSPTLSSVTIF